MSLLDDEIKVMDSWDPSEQIYKDFIDLHMGGSIAPYRGEYHKYSINRDFLLSYIDKFNNSNRGRELHINSPYPPNFSPTELWCSTPALKHIYDPITKLKKYILCPRVGMLVGADNYGKPVFSKDTSLCIMNFEGEELKHYNKPIHIVSTNIDDEIILFNCNPKLEIPGFEVKRIFTDYDAI